MATNYNYFGGIVTNGLVLDLDAAKTDSYPGTGTSWYDISGNNNNGTLTNGPTFSGIGKQASIVFDGSDDFVRTNSGSGINLTNIFTTFIWVKFNSYDTVLLGSDTFSDSGYPLYVENANNLYIAAGGTYTSTTTASLSTNQWIYLTVVRNNTSVTWYKNGINIGTSTLTSSSSNVLKSIGSYNAGGFYLNGNIASTQIYNRALSATEVSQNFNALRGRYGI